MRKLKTKIVVRRLLVEFLFNSTLLVVVLWCGIHQNNLNTFVVISFLAAVALLDGLRLYLKALVALHYLNKKLASWAGFLSVGSVGVGASIDNIFGLNKTFQVVTVKYVFFRF